MNSWACRGAWRRDEVSAGREFPTPSPLFVKLDDSVIEEEIERMKAQKD